MSDFRVYHPGEITGAGSITLAANESHHLVAVNRARSGAEVVVFNGLGREWTATLTDAHRRQAVLQVERELRAVILPGHVTLFQAIPKGGVMENIVRHATELGVRQIVPLLTSRTQVQLDAKRQQKKTDKWVTTALEAAKQCGNPWIPEIAPPTPLSQLAFEDDSFDLLLTASLHPGALSARGLTELIPRDTPAPPRIGWFIGPEGDFSTEEIEHLTGLGAQPISLGPLVLRCDTAATYALSVLNAAMLS